MYPFPGKLLAQSKQRQNYEYDDNQSDEINYSVHGEILSCAMSVRSNQSQIKCAHGERVPRTVFGAQMSYSAAGFCVMRSPSMRWVI
jgi:hypothetical protein